MARNGKEAKKSPVWLNEAVYQNFVTLNVGTDIKRTNLNLIIPLKTILTESVFLLKSWCLPCKTQEFIGVFVKRKNQYS